MAEEMFPQGHFRSPHPSQSPLKEHSQKQTLTTPLGSPNRFQTLRAGTETNYSPDENSPASDPSHAPENGGMQKRHGPNAQAFTSILPSSPLPDTRAVFDGSLPINPHNTPVTDSELPNQFSSLRPVRGIDGERALSPPKSSNISTSWPKYFSQGSYADYTPNSAGNVWKPPRPPKPFFLTDAAFGVTENIENSGPLASTFPAERKVIRSPFSSPSSGLRGPSRPQSRFVEHFSVEEGHASAEERKQLWITRRPHQRYHQRPIPRRGGENNYRVSLGDSDMPFPLPIPTIDKLPLCRPVLSHEAKIAFLRSQSVDQKTSSSRARENTTQKRFVGRIWHLLETTFFWQDLRGLATVTLSLYRSQDSSQSYMVHMEVLPAKTRRAAHPEDHVSSSPPESSVAGFTCLSQIRLPLPVLFFGIVRPFAVGMRHPIFTAITSMLVCFFAIFLRFFAKLNILNLNRLYKNRYDRPKKDPGYSS